MRGRDGIHAAPAEAGIERIEAQFKGNGFSPHRHDTYAIGLTMAGIQTFQYRGERRASQPGQVIVIHPDELHDGGAGTGEGLIYRMIYLPPEQIAEVLQGAGHTGLPFVASPVLSDPEFRQDLADALVDIDAELGGFRRACLLTDLAGCLQRHGDAAGGSRRVVLDWPALRRCRDLLRESIDVAVRMEDLEQATQLDRFQLSRQFRHVFGTSPHRYLIMRRLDRVKRLLMDDTPLAEAAAESGFADQSHMTRHFKRTFGMTPGRWQALNAVRAA